MIKINEKSLENKIKKHLGSHGHYFVKVHGSLFQRVGIPDIIACINGKFVGIEVKNPNGKGKASKVQEFNLDLIQKSDGYTLLTDNFSDYLEFYNEVIKE